MTEGTLGDDGVRDVGPAELDRAVEHGRLGHHGKGRIAMSDQDAFARILALLYGAMLDDTRWPATSALIDEACGITGNALLVGEGPQDDIRVLPVGLYYRGQRREDLERDYVENYHPIDERVPRFRQLPDSLLVHVPDLYTAEELKTSPTYNEITLRSHYQDGLNVRLDGPDASHIAWGLGDPVASDGWGSSEIAMVQALLPHIRQRGYPLAWTAHYMLWSDLELPPRANCTVPDRLVQRFEQAAEQQSTRPSTPAIEAECEFIEVVVQMSDASSHPGILHLVAGPRKWIPPFGNSSGSGRRWSVPRHTGRP